MFSKEAELTGMSLDKEIKIKSVFQIYSFTVSLTFYECRVIKVVNIIKLCTIDQDLEIGLNIFL